MLLDFAKAFLSMLVIIDPLASVSVFLSLTRNAKADKRMEAANEAAFVAAAALVVFILAGEMILEAMGITMPSFKIAGGLVLLIVGVYSVLGIPFTEKKKELDVAIVLIAVPMITGPGAMSMAVIISANYGKPIALVASVLAVITTWLCLRFADNIHRFFGNHGLEIYSRIIGLFVAALAIQFMGEGIKSMVVG